MSVSAGAFYAEALARVNRMYFTQAEQITAAGKLLAGVIGNGGVVHLFGTGHSAAFAMEMANRAGGLVPMDVVALADICTRGSEPWRVIADPATERDPQFAHRVLATHKIAPQDGFIISSNSGRNGSTVEMALEVKRRGLPLVVVTSLEHSRRVTSRHPGGKRLFEIGDVVIDNCGPYGDALLTDERLEAAVCSVSSITGAFIAQMMTAEIVRLLLAEQKPVPVLISANVDGADEHNRMLRDVYAGRISD
ncbi:MAG TPA: SIS domain-containing protein [Symbiobacteriaceae bacterium]|jgi:uncharacterized phosphosugar-binding protein